MQGVIIEPIQATYGDNYLNKKHLKKLATVCKKYNIPLIFDEVQTGFLTSGTVWYFQQLGIYPDIVTYGKKSQVSGIMVKESQSEAFNQQKRLSVTYDGDLIDMIRCKYIIKVLNTNNIQENVKERGNQLYKGLSKIKQIQNVRQTGLLIAFDFATTIERDTFYKQLYNYGMICNPTGEKSIRMRPNLCVTKQEISEALVLIKQCIN